MEGIRVVMDRWPNQVRALEGTVDAIERGVRRLCVTSPTGSGKTQMLTDMIQWAVEHDKAVALYTNRRMLFEQTTRVLEAAGINFGRRASGHDTAYLRSVQVCMWQTEASRVLRSKDRELHPADLVLVDEAHLCGGDQYQRILNAHVEAGASEVGYTATPLDIGAYFDELLIAGRNSDCRECGALVLAETFAPDEPDLRHIRKYQVGEDLSDKDNHKVIMRPGVFGRVLAAWREHNPEQRATILFGPDVAGSLFFAQEFYRAGIRAAHIDGSDCWLDGEFHGSDQETRDRILSLSRSGEIKVICNRFVLREGIDAPWVECGVFATVFGALTPFLQSGGRLLRSSSATGKKRATVIDHGGNWWRHGSLNEDRIWELGQTNYRTVGERAEAMREKREAEPIVCPKCSGVRRGGRQCPYCGYEAHKKCRAVVQIDGSLKQVEGPVHKPRRVKLAPNTASLWEKMYHRAKTKKWDATFRQAEALFFHENHYWPPRTLTKMPKDPRDWWRKVADVPTDALM
ncbi:MAG: DEAD/DEAH box helicase family protein [Candidatus Omnitrophota bacterium]